MLEGMGMSLDEVKVLSQGRGGSFHAWVPRILHNAIPVNMETRP